MQARKAFEGRQRQALGPAFLIMTTAPRRPAPVVSRPMGTVTGQGKYMGVTIHYRGKLDDPGRVENLRLELADIAKSMGWKWQTLDDDWAIPPGGSMVHSDGRATIKGHLGLKGITVTPDGPAESLDFLFDANGRLTSAINVILEGEGRITQDQASNSVKTQFLSPDVHIWIIGLLKYLKRTYMSNLEVSDEGGYWEAGDRDALVAKINLLNEKMAWLTRELTSKRFADLAGLSADDIASRIEQFLRQRRSRADRK